MKKLEELLGRVRSSVTCSRHEAAAVAQSAPTLADYPEHALLQSMQSLYRHDGELTNPYFQARSGELSGSLEIGGSQYTSFSHYNYLGLAQDPRVKQAVHDAVECYGTHAGAARMVGGEIELHARLEAELAEFTGFEATAVSVGGYSTNVAAIGYLLDQRDLIIHDEYMHNSGIMGAVLSGARRLAFPHNDMAALERLLREHRSHYRRALIVVEGAYSMDGDLVDLPRVVQLKQAHGCWLMVDEAHSCGTVGATGRGVCEYFGVAPAQIDLMMGTLSKSFASCGGFLAGRRELIDLLRHFCPGLLLYSTGISPANTAAALAALRLMRAEPERVARLQANARYFRDQAIARGLDCRTAVPGVPIVPLMIDNDGALKLMSRLYENGVIAHAVMHPVVPRDAARLRCFISADHDESMIRRTLDLIVEQLAAGH
ncbi:8-amino-7-oxononanoate synthase [Pseudomonas nitritireducens]|uniref:8-amino-7-oxononanoate synthase n=1 Tax=Pseudomonas nitroreducens TaxID=46680 RepID=A0A7W7P0N1_PSENT|nr:aminotransferase class I/II-fold pyridoxal phosphate-dependent enzyme [Pseudomonas nitritireducens]MBB4862550.1 8-amino-7-oxononanoate synthase [Pseudomonas nitritireducens]